MRLLHLHPRLTGNDSFDPFPGATSSSRLAGILGGGEIGYNYQMGPWVWGLEGDFVWTNARGSKACGNLVSGFGGFSHQCIVQFDLS